MLQVNHHWSFLDIFFEDGLEQEEIILKAIVEQGTRKMFGKIWIRRK